MHASRTNAWTAAPTATTRRPPQTSEAQPPDGSPQAEPNRGDRPKDSQRHQAGLIFGHQAGHREDEQHVGEVCRQGNPVKFQLESKHGAKCHFCPLLHTINQ